MKVFQQLTAKCACPECRAGCLCGDCEACSNARLDSAMVRTAKRVSALVVLAMVLGGFVYFAPVVSLGATPTVTETFSMRVPQPSNATAPLGSISFCLFGDGAVLVNGAYYPNVAVNQTNKGPCSKG